MYVGYKSKIGEEPAKETSRAVSSFRRLDMKNFVRKNGAGGRKISLRAAVMFCIFAFAFSGCSASAANFTVTSGANDGLGSLRQAVSSANANNEADVIDIASAVKEITLSSSIEITGDVVVNGTGATVRGSRTSRLFGISGGTVKFDRFTFTDGYPLSDSGGAAYIDTSAAAVDFVNCTFFGNRAGRSGAAVYLYGGGNRLTTFTNCTIANNEAAENGGGVAIFGGSVQFVASIVTGNKAPLNADIHVSGGVVANTGQYNVIGQTNASSSFSSAFQNDVSVPASVVFKTLDVLTTVNGVRLLELLNATDNVALDKIPTANVLFLPSLDERGAVRPQLTAIDAGAYELSPIALISVELQGSSYIEVFTSENYNVAVWPEEATLDVRAYKDGLSWSVVNPTSAEVLSVDQYGRAMGLSVGSAILKATAHGWDAAGNLIVQETSKEIKVGNVPLTPPSVAVSLVDKKTSMSVNEQVTLRANVKILPEDTPYTVTFESSSPTVASVTQANTTSTSAVMKGLSPGETLVRVVVTAKNSKGEDSDDDSYLLTVTEGSKSGGGGGCQSFFPVSLAGWAAAALFLSKRWRSR
jgi:hypothetical protein